MSSAELYFGTAGWSYKDWEGIFYPSEKPSGFDNLIYYSKFFDCVEINSTFYRPPKVEYSKGWIRKVRENPNFVFTLKLWRRFTHETKEPWGEKVIDIFKNAIDPIVENQKLGALLIQFPWYFENIPSNREYVSTLSYAFEGYPKVIEVRHKSWENDESLDFFKILNLNFCNIDQPVTKKSIGPSSYSTGKIGYVRLHGRNYEKWFKKGAGRDERYDYFYKENELKEWIDRIVEIRKRTERTFVIANNHFKGQAPANAFQLKFEFAKENLNIPEVLVESYPELENIRNREFDS